MTAMVETMFSVREKPWHGLGEIIQEAPTSEDALRLAGLDWNVIQEPVLTKRNEMIPGYRANIRDKDRRVLGVVTDATEWCRILRRLLSRMRCWIMA